MSKIKVIVVDDSQFFRDLFTSILSSDPAIDVVDVAGDPYEAREKIKKHNPDVITLDIEMPHMDGISFLDKIMSLRPMPVVMVSSLTQAGADITIQALEKGAVDYVSKPENINTDAAFTLLKSELIGKVKAASMASISKRYKTSETIQKPEGNYNFNISKIVAIGSSTGGVEALNEVLPYLPANFPPVLVVQHMAEKFVKSFSERLNNACKMKVCEAQDGQKIEQGTIYIAPGSKHLEIAKKGLEYVCAIRDGEPVSSHKPSVDVLFSSIAAVVGGNSIGVILTGMGKDGADGMLKMRQKGAYTIGQDQDSCVIYGMPRMAKELNATMKEMPLKDIAQELIKLASQGN
jgi:two-component system chemotaxis response regulator CheB